MIVYICSTAKMTSLSPNTIWFPHRPQNSCVKNRNKIQREWKEGRKRPRSLALWKECGAEWWWSAHKVHPKIWTYTATDQVPRKDWHKQHKLTKKNSPLLTLPSLHGAGQARAGRKKGGRATNIIPWSLECRICRAGCCSKPRHNI